MCGGTWTHDGIVHVQLSTPGVLAGVFLCILSRAMSTSRVPMSPSWEFREVFCGWFRCRHVYLTCVVSFNDVFGERTTVSKDNEDIVRRVVTDGAGQGDRMRRSMDGESIEDQWCEGVIRPQTPPHHSSRTRA